jgi:hypothetical protein
MPLWPHEARRRWSLSGCSDGMLMPALTGTPWLLEAGGVAEGVEEVLRLTLGWPKLGAEEMGGCGESAMMWSIHVPMFAGLQNASVSRSAKLQQHKQQHVCIEVRNKTRTALREALTSLCTRVRKGDVHGPPTHHSGTQRPVPINEAHDWLCFCPLRNYQLEAASPRCLPCVATERGVSS